MITTLYVKDKITKDLCVSSSAYLAYLGILLTRGKKENIFFARSDLLSYLLTRQYPPVKQIMSIISTGVTELKENKIISIIQSDKSNEWVIDITALNNNYTRDDYYTAIDENDVYTILLSNEKHYGISVSLLRFYIYIVSTLQKKKDGRGGVGFTQLDTITAETGVTHKTARKYLKRLEELNLIYIYHPNDSIIFNTGEIREISSVYGKLEDKDKIIEVGKTYEETYGAAIKNKFKKISKKNGALTRGYSQKYNHLQICVNSGKDAPYSYNECKEIYLAMIDYNEKYKDREERLKDLSVFMIFDFYKQ